MEFLFWLLTYGLLASLVFLAGYLCGYSKRTTFGRERLRIPKGD